MSNLVKTLESSVGKLESLIETVEEASEDVDFPNADGKALEIETKIDELIGEVETALEE